MATFNVYDKLTVAASCYRLLDFRTNKIWDMSGDGAWADVGDVTLANSLIVLTLNSTHNFTPVTLPLGTALGILECDFVAYNLAKASVTNATVPDITARVKVMSGVLTLIEETIHV